LEKGEEKRKLNTNRTIIVGSTVEEKEFGRSERAKRSGNNRLEREGLTKFLESTSQKGAGG